MGWRAALLTLALASLPAAAADPACRVIVGFAKPLPAEAPATLALLATASGANVEFVAAISPHSAAYRLVAPQQGTACARAITALRAHPLIRYVQPDQTKDVR